MGVNGLLPALKPIAKQTHISKYKGQKAAVDGYSWLHKGAYCCARELCEGSWTDKFVTYFLSRIQLLRSNGVEPVVVFDGGRLPIKGQEEQSRHRARKEAREKAAAHLAAGNIAAAVECYQRCVDITPVMAKQVIEELKAQGVAFIVAPYEADAQMAYLARRDDVQLVITEDSDLLAYGCPRVLYKLDKTGSGEEVSISDLPHCSSLPLSSFTSDQFLQLCIMAGCDFLAQLPGIGLKKAHGLLRKYRSFTKVLKMLRFNGTKVQPEYEAQFQKAIWAFRHCRVYCPTAKALQHLSALPAGGLGAADVDVPAALKQLEQEQQHHTLDFLGPDLPQDVAQGIAEGRLDPNSHKPFDLSAIYAGCRRPPPHIAAQLDTAAGAVPHLLGHNSQAGAFSGCGAVSGGARSGAAAASAGPISGGGRSSSGRVGLSKKHTSKGQRKLSWAAAKAAASGGATEGKGAAAAGSTSARKKATLGIAKFFGAPGVQPQQQLVPTAAVDAPAPPAAAARPAEPAAQQGSANNMQHSIRQALHALRHQQQQRHQQAEAEKQQLLSQIREHEQQATAAVVAADEAAATELAPPAAVSELPSLSEPPMVAGPEAPPMPPAKRQRTSADHSNWLANPVDLASSEVDDAVAAAGTATVDASSPHLEQLINQAHLASGSSIVGLGSRDLDRRLHTQQQPVAGLLRGSIPLAEVAEGIALVAPGQTAFLHSLGNADAAAGLRHASAAASVSSDGFGPALAASFGAAGSAGHQLSGIGSLQSAGYADDGRLDGNMNGSLGLGSSSVPGSLESSLGLPASNGGRGAAVSALTALLRGPQQQQLPTPQHRAVGLGLEDSSGAGLGSGGEGDPSQQQRGLLGSCPSGSMHGFTLSSSQGMLGSKQLSSCGVSRGLSPDGLLADCQQPAGPAWLIGRSTGTGLGGCSIMTPQFGDQQQQQQEEEAADEDEVVSPPRPHQLALGGSSTQPWKRLQQSLRSMGGGPNNSLFKALEPVQPGSSLQALKAQLVRSSKRSRLSSTVSSSPEGLGSDVGLGLEVSDGLPSVLDEARVGGDVDVDSSLGTHDMTLGQLQQHPQRQQSGCLGAGIGFDVHYEEKQRRQSAVQHKQQQPSDILEVPDSEDEQDAAAAEPGIGVLGGSSTESSSLDASNDENATPDIHSIAHIRKYAKLASRVVDKVQQQQQVQQQQTQQAERSPLRASAAGNAAAAPVVASQQLARSSKQLTSKLGSGSKGKQAPGRHKTLAAQLTGLKYNPSMFVPVQPLENDITEGLDDGTESMTAGDNSCSVVGVRAAGGLGLGLSAPRVGLGRPAGGARNMFDSQAGRSRGNAARPFKAPRLQHAVDSTGNHAGHAKGSDFFGAFSGFVCT